MQPTGNSIPIPAASSARPARNHLPLGHHNFVGRYCLLMLPLITGFVFAQQKQWQRWLGYGAITINLIALYASGSRGALLGATVLGLVVWVLYCFHTKCKQIKHRILIALSLLFILGTLASNHNAAVLLLPDDPLRSQSHLQRTARLCPRSPHHTCYTLGRSYLSQNKQTEATTGFVLESITYPQFLTASTSDSQMRVSVSSIPTPTRFVTLNNG